MSHTHTTIQPVQSSVQVRRPPFGSSGIAHLLGRELEDRSERRLLWDAKPVDVIAAKSLKSVLSNQPAILRLHSEWKLWVRSERYFERNLGPAIVCNWPISMRAWLRMSAFNLHSSSLLAHFQA